jgi:hypothetical protein
MSAETIYCPAMTYRQTFDSPDEYCENEVEDYGDFCAKHEADNRAEYDRERLMEDERDDR